MKYIYLPVVLIFIILSPVLNAQNVGIGQPSPKSKLDIHGGLTVGTTYSGTNAAPADGAIFEGKIGIGTTSPANVKLDVRGKTYIEGDADVGAGAAKIDLAVDDDNTGLESPADGRLDLYTDSTSLVKLNGKTSNGSPDEGLIYNDYGEDLDFRISGDTSVNTSYKDLFYVNSKKGRIGIKQDNPLTDFHMLGNADGDHADGTFQSYIALLSNTSTHDRKRDGVSINLGGDNGKDNASPQNNFLNFVFNGTIQGAIEGTNGTNPALTYNSGGADYAEWLARKHPAEEMDAGDIVAIKEGQITKNTDGEAQYSVVSHDHVVLGNVPSSSFNAGPQQINKEGSSKGRLTANLETKTPDDKQRIDGEPVSFMGQVKIKVKGEVTPYDYIIPSGNNDGIGIAVSPDDITSAQYRKIVGIAWESSMNPDVKKVNCYISQSLQFHGPPNQENNKMSKIRELKEKLRKQEQRNKQLELKISNIQKRLSNLEDNQ